MTKLFEEIKQRRLARMRMGQDAPQLVDIPSLETDKEGRVRVALVPLTESEHETGLLASANAEAPDNDVGFAFRDRWNQVYDLWQAIREPDDIKKKVFPSPEKMVEVLTVGDINFLAETQLTLMEQASPALDGLTDDDMEELKKAFNQIDLSALSGRSWLHLRTFFQQLPLAALPARLFGPSSTSNLTEKNAS
jgi:hypothetical protein